MTLFSQFVHVSTETITKRSLLLYKIFNQLPHKLHSDILGMPDSLPDVFLKGITLQFL